MLLNTSHVEICSILCIQFVLCIDYPFMKLKVSVTVLNFHNIIWKFSAFDQFSKKYERKTLVVNIELNPL